MRLGERPVSMTTTPRAVAMAVTFTSMQSSTRMRSPTRVTAMGTAGASGSRGSPRTVTGFARRHRSSVVTRCMYISYSTFTSLVVCGRPLLLTR